MKLSVGNIALQQLSKAFEDTRETYSGDSIVPQEVYTLVDTMEGVGRELLKKRRYYQELLKNGGGQEVIYYARQKVDSDITALIRRALEKNPEPRYVIMLEDDDIPENDILVDDKPNTVFWIGDAVDNTEAYLKGGEDYGSALMAVDYKGNVIASLFQFPQQGTVYLAIPGMGAWRNGKPMKVRPMNVRQPVAIIRWPRDKNVVPQEIEVIYREIEKEFSEDGLKVQPGQTLTAADVLSLAEGEPVKFVYYSKPWDFLIAAAIAHTAGATVRMYDCEAKIWKDVFPLNQKLRTSRDRVLFRVERQ